MGQKLGGATSERNHPQAKEQSAEDLAIMAPSKTEEGYMICVIQ